MFKPNNKNSRMMSFIKPKYSLFPSTPLIKCVKILANFEVCPLLETFLIVQRKES